jgi:hypothetical protein
VHVYWNTAWKPSGALAGLLIYKNSSFENHGEEGVGVKSSAFLDGRRVVSIGNALITSAVAQSHAKYLNYVERVRGIRNTSTMDANEKSLAQTHPALAKEAFGWDPSEVTFGSHKKQNWKCPRGHVYHAVVKARTGQGSGCPFCAGRRVLAGFNDLATTHPTLASEADGWDPTTVSAGSHKNLEWRCSLGHVWIFQVQKRTGKQASGCPYCNNLKVLTGFNDLATSDPQLIDEADGWDPTIVYRGSTMRLPWVCKLGHRWSAVVSDRTRIRKGEKTGCPICGWTILLSGFNDLSTINPQIASEADGWNPSKVLASSGEKKSWICNQNHKWEAAINIRHRQGTGCPVCSNNLIIAGVNDLQTLYPSLAAQAVGWDPTLVSSGSPSKQTWQCALGHQWQAAVASRALLNNGCPYCGRKVLLKGFNDLFSLHPEIAAEADGWDPTEVISGTSKKLKWRCSKNHTWEVSARSRVHGQTGCPFCSNNLVVSGENDLLALNPALAAEADGWDPSKVLPGSDAIVPWKCSRDPRHKWRTKIYSRHHGKGCPYCSNQKTLKGVNDLLTTDPELASQAVGWDPSSFTAGSEKVLQWKCPDFPDHLWRAAIKSRKRGRGCPYCSHNALLSGFNDFATRFPSLAKQAHGWDPSKVISGSGQKFEWKCQTDDSHTWKTTITSRVLGSSCPTCNPLGGFNPMLPGYLYFLRHDQWAMLQIGITNEPAVRLGSHAQLGWEALEIRGPMDGYLTRDWETSILRMLKKSGAAIATEDIAGKFDGFTEAWIEESFPVRSLRELMNFVEDSEDEGDSQEASEDS